MNVFEELALQHLTVDPYEFPHPQFNLGKGWSCPDFVSLHIKEKIVRVVEVSIAYKLGNLIRKVNDCDNQWLDKLKTHFAGGSIVDSKWDYRIRIYIRCNSDFRQSKIDQQVEGKLEVVYFEEIRFPWEEGFWRESLIHRYVSK